MNFGTYCLHARAILQHREKSPEGVHFIGLLTKAPTPEGTKWEELEMDGYARQPIHFGPPGAFAGIVRSGPRVSFGEIAHLIPNVRHAGIYNEGGSLTAYGLLTKAPGSRPGATEVAFEAGAVQIRI
jgi:hypothetical protein